MVDNISEYILNKVIKKYEFEIDKHGYDKCKIVEFIMFLFNNLASRYTIRGLASLIYTQCDKYNQHPFKYNGGFSRNKMIVHLLNQDNKYLFWLIKRLIDYNGETK